MMAPPVDVVGPRPRLGDVEAPPRSRSSLSSVAVVESEPLGRVRRRRRLRPGLSPSLGVGRSGVRRLLGLSPSPSPGSGGAEFVVFRGCAQVRALGRAERSSSSSGLCPSPSPGSGGAEFVVFRGLSPSPSPGSGGAEFVVFWG
jgi:hypothetical protein